MTDPDGYCRPLSETEQQIFDGIEQAYGANSKRDWWHQLSQPQRAILAAIAALILTAMIAVCIVGLIWLIDSFVFYATTIDGKVFTPS